MVRSDDPHPPRHRIRKLGFSNYRVCTTRISSRRPTLATVGVKIRVLATRMSDSPLARLIYTAQVVDEDVSPVGAAMWGCGHNHRDPQAAYSCALGWITRSGLADGSSSTQRESTAS